MWQKRRGDYTFCTSRGNSIIEIMLMNPLTPSSFLTKNCGVLPEESFSDHKYLAFELREIVEEVKLTCGIKK